MIHPVKVQYINSNGIEIAYSETGEASLPTVLFIHGLGENMKTWEKNINGLQEHFHCIAIDLPGHGLSQAGDYLYTPYFFAETISGFLQEKKIDNVYLIGHSLGGQITILLSISKPTLIQKLVLIATAGFEKFSESDKRWLNNNSKNYMNPMSALSMLSIIPGFKSSFPSNDVYQAVVKGMLDQSVFEYLNQIHQPTLVIFGEEDPFIPNRFLHPGLTPKTVAENGTKQIPTAELLMVKNAGHFVHIEKAANVDEEIKRFLK